MNVVITGATGFVGRSLISDLTANGFKIWVLSRNPEQARAKFLNSVVTVVENDSDIPKKVAVINLAGESIFQWWSESAKKKIFDSRVRGTEELANRLRGKDIPLWIGVSGVGYYGDRGDEVLKEDAAPGKGFLSEVCINWEAATKKAVATCKVQRHVIFRLGMVLSSEGGAFQKMLPSFKMGAGGKLGTGHQWMSWVHQHDAVNAFRTALTQESWQGLYNLASPEPVQNEEFTKIFGKLLKRPTVLNIPTWLLKTFGGELSNLFLASHRVIPNRLTQEAFPFKYSQTEIALRDLLSDFE